MLSKVPRRPRQVVQDGYVCLSCQLRAQQQRKSSNRPRRGSNRVAIDLPGHDSNVARSESNGEKATTHAATDSSDYRRATRAAHARPINGQLPPSRDTGVEHSNVRRNHDEVEWRYRGSGPLVRKHYGDPTKRSNELVTGRPLVRKYDDRPDRDVFPATTRVQAGVGRGSRRKSDGEESFEGLLRAHAARVDPQRGAREVHELLRRPMPEHASDAAADTSGIEAAVAPSPPHARHATEPRWVWPGTLGRGEVWLREQIGRGTRRENRLYHTSARRLQVTPGTATHHSPFPPPPSAPPPMNENPNGIRAQLRRWQEEHGKDMEDLFKDEAAMDQMEDGETVNNLSRLGDANGLRRRHEDDDEERQAMAHFTSAEDMEDDITDPRFLHMGDLVELEFPMSERESMIAVFVRRMDSESQFYSIGGHWVVMPERNVQYSIPGWLSPKMVEPLLEYLPNDEDMKDMEALRKEAWVNDLSIPRSVAAPLVSRMIAFQEESLEIYRKNASVLDTAHDRLAHDKDLRYGSLTTAATALLKMPAKDLPLTALFTVRKALMNAGFAFNVDRRSHRLTGYLQIRSKEQVKMVEQVRMWLREWQDDLAVSSNLSEAKRKKHVSNRGAKIVNSFLEKTRKIVEKSRENREPTPYGSVGPSKTKHAITPDEDSVKVTTDLQFTEQDQEMVRFIEAWACNNMFLGIPRITALPPLLLTATGLYDGYKMDRKTGFVFLQEIGTIMPYENRIRFDQHLLLPSSQHSKPLENLMTSIMSMEKQPNLQDSMKDLRRDWRDLPVYCIDAASAHEIDDGLSVERVPHAESEKPEWWVHIHIANPTSHFDRNHPLAKMARHMGESIYMPERAYMMLPRWATQRHFSLAKNRPCLTFSARMNDKGEVLEKKIQPGIIGKVHRLTPEEVNELLTLDRAYASEETVLTVGGDPPPAREHKSSAPYMTKTNIDELQALQDLAVKRQGLRKAAGGVFFNKPRTDVNVWQGWKGPGLAWDHPHRRGARSVEGDPVIQMKARGLTNWFSAGDSVVDILVQEMMLLACEISTSWCAERQIPTIYRGSVPKPNMRSAESFYAEVCEPAMRKNGGELPLHIGVEYIRHQGSVVLSTKPLHHKMLGLPHYGKVTSPLRRYGDMILHWQIESALREEARLGHSLISPPDSDPDRSFLPFSEPVLKTIMLGLQPREAMITRAKSYAEAFWQSMLMFRAHHFGEAKLPWEICHAYIAQKPYANASNFTVILEELNLTANMLRPEKMVDLGTGSRLGLGEARLGDRWECVVEEVDIYARIVVLRPLRLVGRWE